MPVDPFQRYMAKKPEERAKEVTKVTGVTHHGNAPPPEPVTPSSSEDVTITENNPFGLSDDATQIFKMQNIPPPVKEANPFGLPADAAIGVIQQTQGKDIYVSYRKPSGEITGYYTKDFLGSLGNIQGEFLAAKYHRGVNQFEDITYQTRGGRYVFNVREQVLATPSEKERYVVSGEVVPDWIKEQINAPDFTSQGFNYVDEYTKKNIEQRMEEIAYEKYLGMDTTKEEQSLQNVISWGVIQPQVSEPYKSSAGGFLSFLTTGFKLDTGVQFTGDLGKYNKKWLDVQKTYLQSNEQAYRQRWESKDYLGLAGQVITSPVAMTVELYGIGAVQEAFGMTSTGRTPIFNVKGKPFTISQAANLEISTIFASSMAGSATKAYTENNLNNFLYGSAIMIYPSIVGYGLGRSSGSALYKGIGSAKETVGSWKTSYNATVTDMIAKDQTFRIWPESGYDTSATLSSMYKNLQINRYNIESGIGSRLIRSGLLENRSMDIGDLTYRLYSKGTKATKIVDYTIQRGYSKALWNVGGTDISMDVNDIFFKSGQKLKQFNYRMGYDTSGTLIEPFGRTLQNISLDLQMTKFDVMTQYRTGKLSPRIDFGYDTSGTLIEPFGRTLNNMRSNLLETKFQVMDQYDTGKLFDMGYDTSGNALSPFGKTIQKGYLKWQDIKFGLMNRMTELKLMDLEDVSTDLYPILGKKYKGFKDLYRKPGWGEIKIISKGSKPFKGYDMSSIETPSIEPSKSKITSYKTITSGGSLEEMQLLYPTRTKIRYTEPEYMSDYWTVPGIARPFTNIPSSVKQTPDVKLDLNLGLGNKNIQNLMQPSEIRYKSEFNLENILIGERAGQELTPLIKPVQANIQTQTVIPERAQGNIQGQLQMQLQELDMQQQLRYDLTTTSLFAFPSETKKERKTKKPTLGGYNVFVKDRIYSHGKKKYSERFLQMNKNPLSEQDAMSLMGTVINESAAATGYIKPTSGKPQRLPFGVDQWDTLSDMFYQKKNKYIEKTDFRINTPGEIKGISALGWIAKQDKQHKPAKTFKRTNDISSDMFNLNSIDEMLIGW